MMKLLLVSLAILIRSAAPAVVVAQTAGGEEQDPSTTTTCQMCGCSYCEEGAYPMGNPGGFIDILDWMATYDDLHNQNTTIAEELGTDEFPFTHLPCSMLEMATSAGDDSDSAAVFCLDLFRLNPVMRSECGCPSLPPPPAGFENPFDGVDLPEASSSSGTTEETTSSSSIPEDTTNEEEEDTTETSSNSGEEDPLVQEPMSDPVEDEEQAEEEEEEEGTLLDNEEDPYSPVVVESNDSPSLTIPFVIGGFILGAGAVGMYAYNKRRLRSGVGTADHGDQELSMKTTEHSIA